MDSSKNALVTIISLIVGIAAISVILSKNAQTTGVIQSLATGFSNALSTAMSPITGTGSK